MDKQEYKCNKCGNVFEALKNGSGVIYTTPCCGHGVTACANSKGTIKPWSKKDLNSILKTLKVA